MTTVNTTTGVGTQARPAPTRPASRHRSLGMPGLSRLVSTEFRIFARDLGTIFFVLAFPTVLLVGMGLAIPGIREPITEAPAPYVGLEAIHLMAPLMICVAIATTGLSSMPTYLAMYRERGVLRRLSTTPMAPQGILLAQLAVNLFWLAVGATLAVVAGILVLDVPLPRDWLLVGLTAPLAVTSIFGIGLIIGGVVRKASTATGLGMLIYFPMLFFAGLWTPGPAMPETLQTVAAWTPLGASGQAMTTAWFADGAFPTLQFVSMALWSVVTFAVAVRVFRWR